MNDHTVMILKALDQNKMKQASLAAYAGMSRFQLSNVLSYNRTLSVRHAIQISKVLKVCSARDLLMAQVEWQLANITSSK